jgi:hypothetical protein
MKLARNHFGLRRQSGAATALSHLRGCGPKRCRAPLATAVQRALAGVLLLGFASRALAQLELLHPEQPSAVFGGGARAVQITFRNSGERPVETSLRTRLFQLSSATRMPVAEAQPWKRLTVLGGQTVLETARLKFPEVRAITKFEVRWLDDADRAAGQTPITVYPTNLLKQLAVIVGDKLPGIFDPHEQLTPLLRALKVEFDDLTEGARLETWCGRLAILGPFDVKQPSPRELQKRAMAMAARGVNVLLLTSQHEPADSAVRAPHALRSAVIIRPVGTACVVNAANELVAGLATQPLAQEKLLELSRLAVSSDGPQIETDP